VALAYFDTSVIVKRYVSESGSAAARGLLRRYELVSSAIAPVELLAALRRRRSAGELSPDQVARVLADSRNDRLFWQLLDVGHRVLSEAEMLLQTTPVRTLDALHIASARCFAATGATPIPFVTADARQRVAADQLGLEVIWVE
jgi:predicted nucleic acid-binding protein